MSWKIYRESLCLVAKQPEPWVSETWEDLGCKSAYYPELSPLSVYRATWASAVESSAD